MKKQRPHRQTPRRKRVRQPEQPVTRNHGGKMSMLGTVVDGVRYHANPLQLAAMVQASLDLRLEHVPVEYRAELENLLALDNPTAVQEARIEELTADHVPDREAVEQRAALHYVALLAKEANISVQETQEALDQMERDGLTKRGANGMADLDVAALQQRMRTRSSRFKPPVEDSELA